MQIPLEDTVFDVLAKAQRGLDIDNEKLSMLTGLELAQIKSLKNGQLEESSLRAIARALQLNETALIELAFHSEIPELINLQGLTQFISPFDEMSVNNYLVTNSKSSHAVAFDTGTDAGALLSHVKKEQLTLALILLTHRHIDHIRDLGRLKSETGAAAFIFQAEACAGAESFTLPKYFEVDGIKIEARPTYGHSRGGITYIIHGLESTVAIVGDALFASSMGGGLVSYKDALMTNRKEIFTLADSTIICPGHGPMTTVGREKLHNPFFPEFHSP